MDNEFKRRLIRHLETACRVYQVAIDRYHENKRFGPGIPDPVVLAEKTEALDDCIKMLALFKR